ncbi:hypothetical protein VTJ04DRAFT_8924 [Mycothermus thermophilus]|uniref:uncharacterized protein n=1 Tax=Humicola insolens TaxID=85995 RepID=UPI00374397F1
MVSSQRQVIFLACLSSGSLGLTTSNNQSHISPVHHPSHSAGGLLRRNLHPAQSRSNINHFSSRGSEHFDLPRAERPPSLLMVPEPPGAPDQLTGLPARCFSQAFIDS